MVNRQCGSDIGTAPLPMNVLTTPMPVLWAKRRSWRAARFLTAPLPARTIGRFASAMRSTARRTTLWSAARPAGLDRGHRRLVALLLGDVLGKFDECPRRVFPASAVLNALRTTSGTVPASQMVCAHLVIGANMAIESMFWWLSLCRRRVLPWPMTHTSGARSMLASATPVTRLVAPGPRVPRHTPALPVSRPYASAANAAACSWRQSTKRMELSSSEIITSAFSSPGTPKMWVTPSASRQRTNRSDAFMNCSPGRARSSGYRRPPGSSR